MRFWDIVENRIVRSLRLDDRPAETFLAAAIQAPSTFGQPEHNRKELNRLITNAASYGAQVIVLPETAVTGYLSDDLKQTWQVDGQEVTAGLTGVNPSSVAETISGPSVEFFTLIARQLGVYLTVPLLEKDPKTEKYYNSVVLLGPNGEMLIHYRKLNPWLWAERGWASEGSLGHPVVDTPFGRFGVLICFDIHKQAQELAKLKIDTLLYSIAWVEEENSDWFAIRLPEIAHNNCYNIVAANWTLPAQSQKPLWHGYGQSTVIDNNGRVLAKAAQDIGPEIILAELPLPSPALPGRDNY